MSSTNMGDMMTLAKQYQDMFVKPVVDAVVVEVRSQLTEFRGELLGVERKVDGVAVDVATLKANEKKALLGWGVIAAGATALLSFGINKAKSLLHLS